MVKEQTNNHIKSFFYGFLSGIFLSGLLLLIFNNSQINPNFIPTSDSTEEYLESSIKSIICENTSHNKQEYTPINLNFASIDELKSLPGIGDVKAKNIIVWREKYGNFKNISELMYISGISDTLFQQICNMITVEN
jgi:competence ComEA-like helix-hairpin-helix protein